MSEETKKAVSRRGLIRRAGTVAAGAGVATVAGVAVASPASAAVGPVNLDVNNAADGTTTITTSSASGAALKLATAGNTAPLVLDPVVLPGDPNAPHPINPATAPAGTTFVDDWGNLSAVAHVGSQKFTNRAYSATWAWMPMPVPGGMIRWVDTRYPSGTATTPGQAFVSGATYESNGSGRIIPKATGNLDTYDALIHFDAMIAAIEGYSGIIGAVQANLTIVAPTGAGFASLYSEPIWPETSSLNFAPGDAVANFTQTWLYNQRVIRVRLGAPAILLLDVAGFIAPSPDNIFDPQSARARGAAASANVSQVPRLG